MCVPPTPPGNIATVRLCGKVDNLDFAYPSSLPGEDERLVLKNFCMQLKPGSRCLLIRCQRLEVSRPSKSFERASTQLRAIVKVMGTDAQGSQAQPHARVPRHAVGHAHGRVRGYGCPLQADIRVGGMMEKLQSQCPEQRDELVKLLGVIPEAPIPCVSDGSVGVFSCCWVWCGPSTCLLLDEVTTCLG